MISFPASPVNGQIYSPGDGAPDYVYNAASETWVTILPTSDPQIFGLLWNNDTVVSVSNGILPVLTWSPDFPLNRLVGEDAYTGVIATMTADPGWSADDLSATMLWSDDPTIETTVPTVTGSNGNFVITEPVGYAYPFIPGYGFIQTAPTDTLSLSVHHTVRPALTAKIDGTMTIGGSSFELFMAPIEAVAGVQWLGTIATYILHVGYFSPSRIAVDWGDGQIDDTDYGGYSNDPLNADTDNLRFTGGHIYDASGTYTVTLTIVNLETEVSASKETTVTDP